MSTIQSSAEHLTLNADGTSKDIKFQANGVEKASISSAGVISSDGGSTHADNVKAKFGTGNDLEIYHDGLNSRIKDVGTGVLAISGNELNFNNADNTTNLLIIKDNGKVGIGQTNPNSDSGAATVLHIGSSSTTGSSLTLEDDESTWEFECNGSLNTAYSGSTKVRINNTNFDFYTNDGSVSSLSDIRVKKDIADLTDGLAIINQLKPKTFEYNGAGEMTEDGGDGVKRYGFIADEVQEVASHYVSVEKGKINGEEVDDLKSLALTRMIPMLVKGIQELSAKNNALESEIAALKAKDDAIEARIAALEA